MRLSTDFLVEQLRQQLAESARTAIRSGLDARDVAQGSSEYAEKREDARSTIEFSNLAHAEGRRVAELRSSIDALDSWASSRRPTYDDDQAVGLGAIIEAMAETEHGVTSKTFVLLPSGAGSELTGPGGDGIISVISPASPVGRAMKGKRVGDVAEVVVRGEPVDWEILEVWS